MAFNKQITGKRFRELRDVLREILGRKPKWKDVTAEQWRKISEFPEFDKSVVEQIIGFTLNLDAETIKIGSYTYSKIEVENRLRDLKPLGEME